MPTEKELIIELETQLSHQQYTVQTLSDVVSEQQKRISQLESKFKILVSRFQDISENARNIDGEQEKPPHY